MVAFASLTLLIFFPRQTSIETFLLAVFSYVILPFVFIRFIVREPISRYGVSFGEGSWTKKISILFGALLIFAVFLLGMRMMGGKDLLPPVSAAVQASFPAFLFSIGVSAVLNGLSCFFFQGFLLFAWREYFGWKSVLWVIFFFTAFLWAKNSFSVESAFFFFIGWFCIASVASFLSRSVFLSFCFLFLSDILLTVFLLSQI